MLGRKAVFVDTSVLVRLIGLDGDELAREAAEEYELRRSRGEAFVLPVTAIIEAGNRLEQQPAKRRDMAKRLESILQQAGRKNPPWVIRDTRLDEQFVQELLDGDSTGSDLVTLIGDGRMGTGDVAILVERDRFREETAYTNVEVWTLDAQLSAFG